jgi:hypothetical protein
MFPFPPNRPDAGHSLSADQALVHEHPEVHLEFVDNVSQRIRVMNEQLESGGS